MRGVSRGYRNSNGQLQSQLNSYRPRKCSREIAPVGCDSQKRVTPLVGKTTLSIGEGEQVWIHGPAGKECTCPRSASRSTSMQFSELKRCTKIITTPGAPGRKRTSFMASLQGPHAPSRLDDCADDEVKGVIATTLHHHDPVSTHIKTQYLCGATAGLLVQRFATLRYTNVARNTLHIQVSRPKLSAGPSTNSVVVADCTSKMRCTTRSALATRKALWHRR